MKSTGALPYWPLLSITGTVQVLRPTLDLIEALTQFHASPTQTLTGLYDEGLTRGDGDAAPL